jgi:hypothetical protein
MVLISYYRKKRIVQFYAGYFKEELSAKEGVSLHQKPVLRFKRALIIQDLPGNLFLTEVVAETRHGDGVDHFVGNAERSRQGRRENADVEGVGKGVVIEVLEFANGFKKFSADGQAGHNRAYDLAGSGNPFGFSEFEVRQNSLSLGKKP